MSRPAPLALLPWPQSTWGWPPGGRAALSCVPTLQTAMVPAMLLRVASVGRGWGAVTAYWDSFWLGCGIDPGPTRGSRANLAF